MRIRISLGIAACCCAVVTACTAGPPKGPNATVTTPAIGKPVPPVSAEAALSSEAFTPYADLGAAPNDGLALGDTYQALHTACMNDAGYGQYATSTPFEVRENRGLGFAQPFGPWGYLPVSLAEQYGFKAPGVGPGPGNGPFNPNSLPAGAQAAVGKCINIVMNFNNAMFAGALAGIETMNNDISDDAINDPDFKKATAAWSACMAKNGFSTSDADSFALNELDALGLRFVGPGGPTKPTAAQNNEQVVKAVTDAQCTESTDLAGIYFAAQASYERQIVTANQQALNAAVREYKAAFARELSKLPDLLRTTSATPNLPGGRRPPGKPGHPRKPSASNSTPGG
ncbi:MAG TPA: hypothetical protein VEV63_03415 [Streptosporangiaceae bacterium]|nr:hypothetical protein [Streptosporangiaceae bacterium]